MGTNMFEGRAVEIYKYVSGKREFLKLGCFYSFSRNEDGEPVIIYEDGDGFLDYSAVGLVKVSGFVDGKS